MKDALKEIYLCLMSSPKIEQATLSNGKHNIFYYKEPDGVMPPVFILIRPLSPPQYVVTASNTPLQQSVTVQIDVQATDRMTCKELQKEIEAALSKINCRSLNYQGLDDYFAESKRFVDARRYKLTTNLYETGY